MSQHFGGHPTVVFLRPTTRILLAAARRRPRGAEFDKGRAESAMIVRRMRRNCGYRAAIDCELDVSTTVVLARLNAVEGVLTHAK